MMHPTRNFLLLSALIFVAIFIEVDAQVKSHNTNNKNVIISSPLARYFFRFSGLQDDAIAQFSSLELLNKPLASIKIVQSAIMRMDTDMRIDNERLERFFSAADLNGDGYWSLHEFLTAYSASYNLQNLEDNVDPTLPTQIHIALGTSSGEMSFMWVTGEALNSSAVQIGLEKGVYNQTFSGTIRTYGFNWNGTVHYVLATQLAPATTYHYRVGDVDTDTWSDDRNFTTQDNKPHSTVFATYGDMGTAIPAGFLVTKQIVEDHQVYNFSVICHNGDLAYASTRVTVKDSSVKYGDEWEFVWDAWVEQISAIADHVPYMTGVGNHERFGNDDTGEYPSYLTRFQMPAPWGYAPGSSGNKGQPHNATFWFSFDDGFAHFTLMSTEHPYEPGTDQYAWLENDMAKARANPNTPWLILTGHRPMYCTDTVEWESHQPGSHFQSVIEPLMIKYQVDLYLCGHMHCYNRIHPNINGTTPYANSTIKGQIYKNPGMPVHVVQGTGGVFNDLNYVVPTPDWSAVALSDMGYGRVHVNATHIHYEFARMETRTVVDDFYIVKD